MNFQDFQHQFIQALAPIHEKSEVLSIFYLLLDHHFEIKRFQWQSFKTKELSVEEETKLLKALDRLKSAEPIQYVLGETSFFGLPFKVNENVLIPRPETEELVDWIIKDYNKTKKALKILDIGTGSGCIAVSLATHFTKAQVFAVDISKEALEIAKSNAISNATEVTFHEMDILNFQDYCQVFDAHQFDIIVANPPYVRHSEKTFMHTNVVHFEPHKALFVHDQDPFIFYKAISDFAAKYLVPQGSVYFEINEYLGTELTQELQGSTLFNNVTLRKDLNQKNRMIKLSK